MEPDDFDNQCNCQESENEKVRVWRVDVFKKPIKTSTYTPVTSCRNNDESVGISHESEKVGEFKIVRVPPESSASDEYHEKDIERHFERLEEQESVEFIKTLHEAYEAATEQQQQDRQEMAALEEVILMFTNQNSDDMKNVLKKIYSQKEEGKSMAGALAGFFQKQLQELISKHELHVQELQTNLASWMQQCEELKNGDSKKEEQEETMSTFVAKLHKQLGAKNIKLQKLNNVVHQLEKKIASLTKMNSLEERQALNYQQLKQQNKLLQEEITALKQQKHQLLSEISRCRELKSASTLQIKEIQDQLQRERDRMKKVLKQLKKYERERAHGSTESSSSSSRERSKAELEIHTSHLNAKLAKVEQQVKEISKKDVRDKVTDIESAFLQSLESNSISNSLDATNTLTTKDCADTNTSIDSTKNTKRNSSLALTDEGKLKAQQGLESLKSKLRQYEHDLAASEMDRRLAGHAMADLTEKLKNSKQPSPLEECLRVQELVRHLEELQCENRDLRHDIAVDKEEHIMKLENELKKLRTIANKKPILPGSDSGSSTSQENKLTELETIIADKNKQILQLRFEKDEAKRKMLEIETKFDILFKEWVEENSRKPEVSKPIFGTPQKTSKKAQGSKIAEIDSIKKENELQLFVFTLKRVVDKLRRENSRLRKSGLGETRYQKLLKANKELKNTIDILNFKIANYVKVSPHMQLPVLEQTVKGLTEDVETLTDVNAELIHVLRQVEDKYPNVRNEIRCKAGAANLANHYFVNKAKKKRILLKQKGEIERLQDELGKAIQLNNDLIYQIAKREDELDLVHGKLYVQSVVGVEGVRKDLNKSHNPPELKSHATTVINNGCFEVMPGDCIARSAIQTFDASIVDEIDELRLKHHNLAEICKHYEELLVEYTHRLQVPFTPVRQIQTAQ
ncbi:hypothetical protein SELMODRAFT_423305 [Selaginella moellendorffii]|uniref:Uncharacterized protein n=1 Tax=Selaginella moellendorffii TaxID=88036 RepID=D8SL87_SELML|nr:hypothetical protein SELMODRAFT_423305 [Selaginella moellendorffii]